jgi:hypothetical protein
MAQSAHAFFSGRPLPCDPPRSSAPLAAGQWSSFISTRALLELSMLFFFFFFFKHSVTHRQYNFSLIKVQAFNPPQLKCKELFFMFIKKWNFF